MKTLAPIPAMLSAIRDKLDTIESHLIWLIKPEGRFRVGQRVEFSRRARESGLFSRKRSAKGLVKAIDGFSVIVQLDGQKGRRRYHHAFFNPVSGPKLF